MMSVPGLAAVCRTCGTRQPDPNGVYPSCVQCRSGAHCFYLIDVETFERERKQAKAMQDAVVLCSRCGTKQPEPAGENCTKCHAPGRPDGQNSGYFVFVDKETWHRRKAANERQVAALDGISAVFKASFTNWPPWQPLAPLPTEDPKTSK